MFGSKKTAAYYGTLEHPLIVTSRELELEEKLLDPINIRMSNRTLIIIVIVTNNPKGRLSSQQVACLLRLLPYLPIMPGLLTNLQLKWFPAPLPQPGSYDGQRVVVVGATTGLGLASAVHFLNLGAREVIITARSAHRGQIAKDKIEAQTNTAGQHRVKVMDVDMNRYSSIIAFVDHLKSQYSDNGGLDCVVLSAGTHNAGFVLSPGGW